jgi:hypothetical protein
MNAAKTMVRLTLKKIVKKEFNISNPDGIRVEIDKLNNKVTLGALYNDNGEPKTKITSKILSSSEYSDILKDRMTECDKACLVVKGKSVFCYTYDEDLNRTEIEL